MYKCPHCGNDRIMTTDHAILEDLEGERFSKLTLKCMQCLKSFQMVEPLFPKPVEIDRETTSKAQDYTATLFDRILIEVHRSDMNGTQVALFLDAIVKGLQQCIDTYKTKIGA